MDAWRTALVDSRDGHIRIRGYDVPALMTGRTLYTSIEATAIHKPDADKLHREEFVEVSVEDAERLGIADGDEVTLATDQGEMRIRAQVTDLVPAGSVFVPLLYNGGEVTSILPAENGVTAPVREPENFEPYALRQTVTRLIAERFGSEIHMNGECQPPCGRYGVPLADAPL